MEVMKLLRNALPSDDAFPPPQRVKRSPGIEMISDPSLVPLAVVKATVLQMATPRANYQNVAHNELDVECTTGLSSLRAKYAVVLANFQTD